jgi:hypothetical protein
MGQRVTLMVSVNTRNLYPTTESIPYLRWLHRCISWPGISASFHTLKLKLSCNIIYIHGTMIDPRRNKRDDGPSGSCDSAGVNVQVVVRCRCALCLTASWLSPDVMFSVSPDFYTVKYPSHAPVFVSSLSLSPRLTPYALLSSQRAGLDLRVKSRPMHQK